MASRINVSLLMLFCAAITLSAAAPTNKKSGINDPDWDNWKSTHAKSYSDVNDESYRYSIYSRNKAYVQAQNQRPSAPGLRLALNKLADLTDAEIGQRLGLKVPADQQQPSVGGGRTTTKATTTTTKATSTTTTTTQATTTTTTASTTTTPAAGSLDWRTQGVVTPVKDQGQCGSCWSFSSTGALEGRYKLKYGSLVSLSEQNLVDCSSTSTYGNAGCNGGWMNSAFKYVRDVAGINTEAAYPYKAVQGSCVFNSTASAKYAALTTAQTYPYVNVQVGSEAALVQALQSGPVAIAFDASQSSFNYYSGGVYSDTVCSAANIDHAMLVVGYGVDSATNQPYWLVKNSWGTWWGEQGYIRVLRNGSNLNMCGILSYASYPVLA